MTTATQESVQTKPATEPTPELIAELRAGTKTMDGLAPEIRRKAMIQLNAEPDDVVADVLPDIVKPVEKKIEIPVEPSVADLTARRDAAKAEHTRLANEANTFEQKTLAAKARRDKSKKDFEDASKTEVKLPDELLSEENQSLLLKRMATIENQNEAFKKIILDRDEEEIKTSELNHRTASEKLQFREIDEVQAEFESLKLEQPFEVENAKYGAWLTEIQTASGLKEKNPDMKPEVLRTKAVELWNADPEFQKKISNKPPNNLDKLQTLLIAYNKKLEVGGSVMGHLLEHLKRTGTLSEMVQRVAQNSAADAANRTVKALKSDTINPVGPGDGASRGYQEQGDWTPSKAKTIIQAANTKQSSGVRLLPEERKQVQEAMNFLQSGG